ncbi:STAS domain-containing protein [Streptomyces xiangluensis]|uniref:STAS domain-containing protein n=1 Tax=Streptomyces xiangluensis TaxID=2665720 RepID=A0ABV8YQG5_9ACTN
MVQQPTYGLRERRLSNSTVIELSGELDLLATTELATSLDAVCATQPRQLVLDLRKVTFLDCSGLSLLCRIRNRLRGQRSRLLLVTRRPAPPTPPAPDPALGHVRHRHGCGLRCCTSPGTGRLE